MWIIQYVLYGIQNFKGVSKEYVDYVSKILVEQMKLKCVEEENMTDYLFGGNEEI